MRDPVYQLLNDLAVERMRQEEAEGFTPEHDDQHSRGELAMAAALYAAPRPLHEVFLYGTSIRWQDPWPWSHREYEGREQGDDPPTRKVLDGDGRQKHDRRRALIIAGALIMAEIERIDRRDGRQTPLEKQISDYERKREAMRVRGG